MADQGGNPRRHEQSRLDEHAIMLRTIGKQLDEHAVMLRTIGTQSKFFLQPNGIDTIKTLGNNRNHDHEIP